MPSNPIRVRICCLWLLVAVSALTCILLPVIGPGSFFDSFNVAYSGSLHVRLLAGQLTGPVFTLSMSLALLVPVMMRKHIAWWLWLITLSGPVYTTGAVGSLSHDFSHAVFQECSGVYGAWIMNSCIVAGVALVVIALLVLVDQKRPSRAPSC